MALLGQILPWLAGSAFYALLFWKREDGQLSLALGVGFLLGAATVYVGLRWFGLGVVSQLVLIFILFLTATVFFSHRHSLFGKIILNYNGLLRWLLILLLMLHLVISWLDMAQRPIFPWDAWTTWIYRAKAWFISGELSPIVMPQVFWAPPTGSAYTISAANYPDLTSIYQYWTALSLGTWDEQSLAITWLLLCVAICLGVFGLGRQLGFSSIISLFLSYLFVSLPMIGIHVTLAGYSDIWMAGYVGVGFGVLLVGLVKSSAKVVVLGLLLCSIAVLVKKEGAIWLVLAFWIVSIHLSPRWWWNLILVGVLSTIVILWSIWNSNDGVVGLLEGKIALPLVGEVQLQFNDVIWPFIHNLLMMGNWNLFWYMLPLTIGAGFIAWKNRESRVALSIIIWPLISIVTLFVFSDQGAWAKDFTAINRLFIHFIPAWLLSGVVIFRAYYLKSSEGGKCIVG